MKAVVLHNYGGIDQLNLEEEPMPSIGAKEVRVRLHATSSNPTLRAGWFATRQDFHSYCAPSLIWLPQGSPEAAVKLSLTSEAP